MNDALSRHPQLGTGGPAAPSIGSSAPDTVSPPPPDTVSPPPPDTASPLPPNTGDALSRYPDLSKPLSARETAKPMLNAVRGKIGDGQAEVVDIARRRGLTPTLVDGHLDTLRDADRDDALAEAPRTAAFLQDESNARLGADDVAALARLEAALLTAPQQVKGLRKGVETLADIERGITGNTTGAKIARAPVTALRKAGDLGVSGYVGFQNMFGSSVRGFSRLTESIGNVANEKVAEVFPSTEKYLFMQEDSPAWIKRVDAAGSALGDAIESAGQNIADQAIGLDIPEDRKGFDTELAAGAGGMVAQIGVTIGTGGTGGGLFMASAGADEQAQRQQESGTHGQEGLKDDLAIIGSAAVVPFLEKIGLDKILDNVPAPVKSKALTYISDIGKSAVTEGATEALEGIALSGIEKVSTNKDAKLFDGVSDDATMGAALGGMFRAVALAAIPGNQRRSSVSELETLDEVMDDVAQSKLAARDPKTMSAFLQSLDVTGEVYLPAAAAVELYQSEQAVADEWGVEVEDVAAALALGDDIAVPVSDFISKGADPIMGDLRRIVRTAPDRFNEVELANAELQEQIDKEFEAVFDQQIEDLNVSMGVARTKQDVEARLVSVGVAPSVARAQGQVWGAMFDTLAAKGVDVSEIYDRLSLRIDGPNTEAAPAPTALSVMIDDIKAGVQIDETAAFGTTLTDMMRERGINDDQGDLAAMDVPKGVLREDGGSLDDMAVAAWEDGFFEDVPDRAELLEAIRDDMAGHGPRAIGSGDPVLAERIESMRRVEEMLDNAGLDIQSLSTPDLVAGLEAFAAQEDAVGLGISGQSGQDAQTGGGRIAAQGAVDADGISYDQSGTVNRDENFKAWFGDSKVVDDNGEPLVVYHGTNANAYSDGSFNVFNTNGERAGAYFSTSREQAETYGQEVYETHLNIQNPLVINAGGRSWSDLAEATIESEPTAELSEFENKRNAEADALFADLFAEMGDLGLDGDASVEEGPSEKLAGDLPHGPTDVDALAALARRFGYDGLIVKDVLDGPVSDSTQVAADTIVALNPRQVKSVNNRGTYDPADPNILNQSTPLKIAENETFKTGQPVTFDYVHNQNSATKNMGLPKAGDAFQRDFEPSGKYITPLKPSEVKPLRDGYEGGKVTFKNPLVIDVQAGKWKKPLSEKYGKTGKELSKAIIADGHDGIVTLSVLKNRTTTSEAVDLTTFDESSALYQSDTDVTKAPLVAVHNLSEENFHHADALGALPAPSVAIVRGDIGFDSFGEITLVGGPRTFAPGGEGVRAFNADVYTPRQPRAKYGYSGKEVVAATDKINAGLDQALKTDNLDVRDAIERGGIDELAKNRSVKAAFLLSKGEAIEVAYVEPPDIGELLGGFVDYAPAEGVALEDDAVFIAALEDDRADFIAAREEDGKSAETIARITAYSHDENGNIKDSYILSQAKRVRSAQNAKVNPRVDRHDTMKRVEAAIDPVKAEYENWVHDTFGDLQGDAYFESRSGRRYPYDVDKLVREMTQEIRGAEGFNFGTGVVRAMVAKEFKSVSAVQSARGDIITSEEMDKLKDETSDRYHELANKFAPLHRSGDEFGFGDIFNEYLKDLAAGREAEWYSDIFTEKPSKALIDEAQGFLDALRVMPTEYFEVKMQRAVKLREFSGAVVPSDISDNTRKRLEAAGLTLSEYDRSNPEARVQAMQAFDREFFQSEDGDGSTPTPNADTARASVAIPADGVLGNGDTVVRLMEASDHTSFLHESAHIFLEIYSELEGDNAAVAAEMVEIRKWLNVKEGQGPFNRDQHEKFAEGFEAYLFEGKAPNVELRGVFSRFKAWFTRVYSSVRNMRIKLDADSRAIFDRMLATEDQIDAARAADSFEVPEAIADLMEPDMAQRYRDDVEAARNEASEDLMRKTLKELDRQGRADRRGFRILIKEEVIADVESRPVYRAFKEMSDPNSDMKMDREEIERLVGSSVVKKLMKGKSAVYKNRRRLTHEEAVQAYGKDYRKTFTSPSQKYAYAPGGIHPDDAALRFGFASGEALILALAGEPKLSDAIKIEMEKRVTAEYGSPHTDGTLEEEAQLAVRNDPQERVLQAEQAVLARKALAEPMPLAQIKAIAKVRIEEAPHRSVIRPGLDAHYANLAAKRAVRLAGQEKWVEALRAKQQQQMHHEMARIGWNAKHEAEGIIRYLKRYGPRAKIDPKRMGVAHIGMIRRLSDLPGTTDQADARQILIDFMNSSALDGNPIILPAAVLKGEDLKPVREMSLIEMRDYRDAIKSVVFQGRKASEEAKEARKERAAADGVIIRNGWGNKPLKEFERKVETLKDRAGDAARAADAQILRYPFLVESLQGGKTGELVSDLETNLRKQLIGRNQRRTEMDAAFHAILEKHGITRKELQTRIMVGEISGAAVTFEQVFSLALNMGTEQGASRIYSDPSTAEDPASIQDLLDRKMSKRHWDAAQEIWDLLSTLWPEAQAVEERMTGVKPIGVKAIPVHTKYGTYSGGYYPIAYDHAAIDNKKIADADQTDIWAQLTAGVTTRAKTPQGYLIERQKFVSRPVNLRLDVALRHIDDATNDIYMREVATEVSTRIRHPIFERAVAETHGREYLKTLETVMKRTVAGTERVQDPFDAVMRTARVNASMAILGFKVTTAALAPVSYAQTILPRYGRKVVASGLSQFFGGGPKRMVEQSKLINEKSTFMRERNALITREAHEMVRKTEAASRWDKFRASGYMLMTGIEKYTVSGPLWLGVYQDALDRGEPEDNAITEADRAIATTQGSGLEMDQSIMQGDVETKRALTFMWGYMSGYYGVVRNDIQSAKGAKKVWPILRHMVLLNAAAAVMETLVRGEFGDDEDPYLSQVISRMQRNILGLIPGPSIWFNRYGGQDSISSAGQNIVQAGGSIKNVGTELIDNGYVEGETAIKAARTTGEAMGFAFGVPGTVQASQAAKVYIEDDDPTLFEALVSGMDNE